MTSSGLIFSSAYFPPVHYIALAALAGEFLIEKEENYIKQTYRNRCHILSANGPLSLSVPVLIGSFHKTHIKDIRIDHSKRWKQIHIGAIISAYRSSPYFEYYFEKVQEVINRGDNFLLDLNMKSLEVILDLTGISSTAGYTKEYLPSRMETIDFRYNISPKQKDGFPEFRFDRYHQVFSDRYDFIQGLSAIDLIFNTGPDAINHLSETGLRI